ncbi:MAG: GntR family transcriptional regulator [Hyphomicrobiaceae bacterium]
MSDNSPIYKIVKDSLREKIDTGVLAIGERIASEEVLASEFGCSRLTVHRALRELANEGLLVRNRRAGTQVASRNSGGVLIRIPRVREEIEAQGQNYRYEFLRRRYAVPRKSVATLLRVSKDRKMLNVTCRHWAGNRVFQYEDRWINVDIAHGSLDIDFRSTSANEWLLDNVASSCVDHEISATIADQASASVLLIEEGAALLRIRRLTHLTVRRMTYAVLLHPGDLLMLRSEAHDYSLNSS